MDVVGLIPRRGNRLDGMLCALRTQSPRYHTKFDLFHNSWTDSLVNFPADLLAQREKLPLPDPIFDFDNQI